MRVLIILALLASSNAAAQVPFQQARFERIARRILVNYCYTEYEKGGVRQGSDCRCFVDTLILSLTLDEIADIAQESPFPRDQLRLAKRQCGVPIN